MAALSVILIATTASLAQPTDPASLRTALLPPVVRITAGDSIGTGFVIRGDKVVTAAHVVGDRAAAIVEFFRYDERGKSRVGNTMAAQVTRVDTESDLALIRVAIPDYVGRVDLASEEEFLLIGVFHPVIVVGCPLGQTPRPAVGLLTSLSGFGIYHGISAHGTIGVSGSPVFARIGGLWRVIGVSGATWFSHGDRVPELSGSIKHSLLLKFLAKKDG